MGNETFPSLSYFKESKNEALTHAKPVKLCANPYCDHLIHLQQ